MGIDKQGVSFKSLPDTSSFGRYPIVNKSLSYSLTGLVHTEKRDHIMRHVVAYKSSRALMRGGRLREVLIIGALTKKMLVFCIGGR